MHSHDRTLLARLGFQDPDKQDPLHDLACQYVARKRRTSLAKAVIGKNLKSIESYELEAPISKGQGQFKTTIGFLDVLMHCEVTDRDVAGKLFKADASIIVEVKIAEIAVGDLLRQIKLYQEYIHDDGFGGCYMAAVVAYPIKLRDVRALREESIFVAQLGPKFDAWAKAGAQTKKAKLKRL